MRDKELIYRLADLLNSLNDKRVVIITHVGGDADAIGSAYALKRILEDSVGCSYVKVIVPNDISAHMKQMLSYLGIEQVDERIDDADMIFLVDVGSLEHTGEYLDAIKRNAEKVCIVDHHMQPMGGYPSGSKVFVSNSYRATSEILFDLIQAMGVPMDKKITEALFLGIYYDTSRLMLADNEVLLKVCRLASMGLNPSDVLQSIEVPIDISERIARLKGAMRMNLYRIDDWLIATSHVSSFQTSVARALIMLGCHVAFVGGEDKGHTVLSMRSQSEFFSKTGINLGKDLIQKLSMSLGGFGGGHPTAARFHTSSSLNKVLDECLKFIEKSLGGKLTRVQ